LTSGGEGVGVGIDKQWGIEEARPFETPD